MLRSARCGRSHGCSCAEHDEAQRKVSRTRLPRHLRDPRFGLREGKPPDLCRAVGVGEGGGDDGLHHRQRKDIHQDGDDEVHPRDRVVDGEDIDERAPIEGVARSNPARLFQYETIGHDERRDLDAAYPMTERRDRVADGGEEITKLHRVTALRLDAGHDPAEVEGTLVRDGVPEQEVAKARSLIGRDTGANPRMPKRRRADVADPRGRRRGLAEPDACFDHRDPEGQRYLRVRSREDRHGRSVARFRGFAEAREGRGSPEAITRICETTKDLSTGSLSL